jgi:hypothetical protein
VGTPATLHLVSYEWFAPCSVIDRSPGANIPTQIGDKVRFRAGSVFFWPEESPLNSLPASAELGGKVIAFSDSGSEPRVFAVVEVFTKHTVIVPVTGLDVIAQRD